MAVLVGVGIILLNEQGQILLGKRCGRHAPYWSIPGGHLDAGESFERCARREMREETGLEIGVLRLVALTNNLRTWREEGKHTVSVCLQAEYLGGVPELKEPDKCQQWIWCDPLQLPEPHFEASSSSIQQWLMQRIYQADNGDGIPHPESV